MVLRDCCLSESYWSIFLISFEIWPHCFNNSTYYNTQCVYAFNGDQTNCRIAHILGTLLMIRYWFAFYFSDIMVYYEMHSFNSNLVNLLFLINIFLDWSQAQSFTHFEESFLLLKTNLNLKQRPPTMYCYKPQLNDGRTSARIFTFARNCKQQDQMATHRNMYCILHVHVQLIVHQNNGWILILLSNF